MIAGEAVWEGHGNANENSSCIHSIVKTRRGPVLLGVLWGLVQGGVVVWTASQGILLSCCFGYLMEAYNTTLRVFVQALVGIAAFVVGYSLAEAEGTLEAVAVSQPVSYSVGLGILYVFYPSVFSVLWEQYTFLVFLPVWYLILGLGAGLFGSYLGEWMGSLSALSLDWRLVSMGLLAGILVAILPVSLSPTSFIENQQEYWTVPVLREPWAISFLAAIVVTGLILAVLGLGREGFLEPHRAGLLLVTSLILVGITIVSLGFATTAYDLCTPHFGNPPKVNCAQTRTEDFLHLTWLLYASLLIPAVVFFGYAFPRYWSPSQKRDLQTPAGEASPEFSDLNFWLSPLSQF